MQFHSSDVKILEFCSLILSPSQNSCTIRACASLELKNTFFQITVKDCETSESPSVSTADLFFGYLAMPMDSHFTRVGA